MAADPEPARAATADDAAASPAEPAFTARLWTRAVGSPSAMIVANTAAQSLLRLVTNVVLARLLAPSAFALTAITAIITTGIQMVSDVGIAITALREGEMSRADEDRLWTMQLLRGFGVGLLLIAAAAPVGWLYDDVRLRDILLVLTLMPIVQGTQSLYPILALGHRRLLPGTLLELGGRVGGMTLSIIWALVSPTVWALVIGTLSGTLVSAVASHVMARRLPRFVFDLAYIRKQWRFARWIQTSSTLTFVGAQVDKALFPFLFNLPLLGIYGIASTFAAMPTQVTQRWSASVFYPLAVQLLTGGPEPRRQLMRMRTTMLLYTAIITVAMAAAAPPFFLLLYTPRYHAAAWFAQVLALGVFFDTAESSLRHFPLVEDTPRFEVWVVLVRLAAFGIGAPVAYALNGGAIGYAIAYVTGLAAGHAFMLTTCVRRGYLSPAVDIGLTATVVAIGAALYWVPTPTTRGSLAIWAVVVGASALAGLFLVYRRRGLPSLRAEPAPAVLRAAAQEELGLEPGRGA